MAKRKKLVFSKRAYGFTLPYSISAVNAFWGIHLLQGNRLFQNLPADLQARMQKAVDEWHPMRVSKDDLDRIDDTTWKSIADNLKLDWEPVK